REIRELLRDRRDDQPEGGRKEHEHADVHEDDRHRPVERRGAIDTIDEWSEDVRERPRDDEDEQYIRDDGHGLPYLREDLHREVDREQNRDDPKKLPITIAESHPV